MIIDFHGHILPAEAYENPLAFAEGEPYFGYAMINSPAKGVEKLWQGYEEALKVMDQNGVGQLLIQGWPLVQYENCWRQNNATLAAMEAYPQRFMGFCIVNPKDNINALREVERCAAAGMKGVGELDPVGQGFSLDDDDFLRLCDLCIELNLPISLHVDKPIGPFYHGKSVMPLQQYINLAQAKPLLKIILAHWGGGLPFYELMPDLRKSLTNVYYDTAGSPVDNVPGIIAPTVEIIGHEKLLFGSNFPLLEPWEDEGIQSGPYSPLLDEIKDQIRDIDARENILYQNAARLLGLTANKEDGLCLE